MTIKQISVFIGNKTGRLADITSLLEREGIDIRALSIADTTDYGVLRMIVDDPERAVAALKSEKLTAIATEVLGIEIPDAPGGFARAVGALAKDGVGVEYAYAFLSQKIGKACVILRVADNEQAQKALVENSIRLISQDEAFGKQ